MKSVNNTYSDGEFAGYRYIDDSGMSGMYFRYNADGIRTYKSHYDHNTLDMYHVNYVLDGTKIVSEYYTHEITNATYTIRYYYDANDSVIGFNYNGTDYYYRKNLQGDIIAILNTSGTKVVEYTYNAWGEVLGVTGSQASTIGQINPFRYRGYYYDTETGFYYLQSRYYDPVVGRFLNADEIMNTMMNDSANVMIDLYSYCLNNPINFIDPNGTSATLAIAGVTISVGTAIVLLITGVFIIKYIFDRDFRNGVNSFITSVLTGAIYGIRYLSNVLSDIIEAARKARNYRGYEDHHIVAQNDSRAYYTKTLIEKYGVHTYDTWNIVSIRTTFHRHLHTNAYFAAVDMIIRSSVYSKIGYYEKKYAIIGCLVFIGGILKTLSGSWF